MEPNSVATYDSLGDRLMLVLPLPIHRLNGQFFIEAQAANGLRLWLEHFTQVTLLCPLRDEPVPRTSVPVSTVPGVSRLEVVPLPSTYTPVSFARALPATRRLLAHQIERSRYLHFAIGGLIGDWGAVAGLIAKGRHRPFAVWTDRVESSVAHFQANEFLGLKKIYRRTLARVMRHYERHVIRQSTLGLFHGGGCYSAYSRFSCEPHLVHNIHLGREAQISAEELAAKLSREAGTVPRVVYAGRVSREKGVFDWVEVLVRVAATGQPFVAQWFGEGPQLVAARSLVQRHGLADRITFPGPTYDRAKLLAVIRKQDIFLFCHKTPESPRCLIEALISGTPIVGYETEYSKDLIRKEGGGLLTPADDSAALAATVSNLLSDRQRLARFAELAAAAGRQYSDDQVFAHRSQIMKTLLPHRRLRPGYKITSRVPRLFSENRGDRLMLVLPLPIHRLNGQFFIEAQAANGLRLWLEHFTQVTLLCPLRDEPVPRTSVPVSTVPGVSRLEVVPLPSTYTPVSFARALPATRRLLAHQIERSRYLHFAIGGLIGDWGAVAGLIAKGRHRPFAVWTDRVESSVAHFQANEFLGLKKIYRRTLARVMRHYERHVIRQSTLGLFHGGGCYSAYSRFSCEPHLVHNIHLGREAQISAEELAAKLSREAGTVPRVVYAGRVSREKGVFDWVEVLVRVAATGQPFVAQWFGEGPQLVAARSLVQRHGLADRITFPGPTYDRAKLLAVIRKQDIFLFCHKTPESPRCLIEALISGTPIVGYETEYSKDLIRKEGGGLLTPADDSAALAATVSNLLSDRQRLARFAELAAAAGRQYSDDQVFAHRSQIMKTLPVE